MNVLKVYRSLNADQKQILAEKQINLNRPIAELLALLKPVANCDKVADKARTKLGCTFAASIVLTIVLSIVITAAAGCFGVLVIVVGIAVAVISGYLWFWTKKIDVSNNMRDFAIPVLTVIREDVGDANPVHLKLDLRPPTSKEKRTSEGEPYKSGVYYKVIDSIYVDPWMTFEGVLTDGTKLSWSIVDTIRERKKTKRNPRGKIKTKTKYMKKTDIEVEVGLRRKRYEITDVPAEAEVETGDKRNTVKVDHRERTASLDPIPPKVLIDLVANVYGKARPAQKEA